ncbi:MAG: family 14 glycosylhydrolase [Bdellovibrionales bacterium]|nr:family 14 glycosylhydrolase [Bdellovibrionales bacterium]
MVKLAYSMAFALSFVSMMAWAELTTTVMAPLTIGDWRNPDNPDRESEWRRYGQQLVQLKSMGVDAISTDVWWGLIEPEEGQFNWRYYQKLHQLISEAGMKWVPILSFHKLGGNVGDPADQVIPIPNYIWQRWRKYPDQLGSEVDLMSRSETGSYSSEVVSPNATPYVLEDYRRVMREFQAAFSYARDDILEINISLGPAGELRYPSYNQHDSDAIYPGRGRFQMYSELWKRGFRNYMKNKRGTLDAINMNWGTELGSFDEIRPPEDVGLFLLKEDQFGPYGMDLFDYQNQVLIDHAQLILGAAFEEFDSNESSFAGIDLGAKIPGIHWRFESDRHAELASGLIRTRYGREGWRTDETNYGYQETLKAFKTIADRARSSRFVLHFTALEMFDGDGGDHVGSRAKSLVFFMAQAATSLGLTLKGENALDYKLDFEPSWDNIKDGVAWGPYYGMTFLRHHKFFESEFALNSLRDFIFWKAAQCYFETRQPPVLRGRAQPLRSAE